ncbi:unnamed protein product [Chironomus riparius]|uniref:Ionotropic glutamate receptor C-terminal domain-containing protein n=1 Tax=Chironomus riparius TaxID=315576 RepID=A0A9N9RJL5_9DIPT|nr:unnamed protein product [Chironomus riparius]
MILRLKFAAVLVFYSVTINSNLCDQNVDDSSVIAHVLYETVNEFIIKQNLKFDVFVHSLRNNSDILNGFLAKNDCKFSCRIVTYNMEPKSVNWMFNSGLIFVNSIDEFFQLTETFNMMFNQDHAIKSFVFIPNLNSSELLSFEIWKNHKHLRLYTDNIIHYSYFILNESDKIHLVTFEWYAFNRCNYITTSTLNVFNKKRMKWNFELKNYDKFMNYYGCELILMLPIDVEKKNHISEYDWIQSGMEHQFAKETIIPFKIASKKYNFRIGYQMGVSRSDDLLFSDPNHIRMFSRNSTIKIPSIYFETKGLPEISFRCGKTNSFSEQKLLMVSTPEFYEPYNKLLLPFNYLTWILIFITFLTAFMSMSIINRSPNKLKNVVYGKKVTNPVWNVVGIIFGIGRTRLPDKSLARFILLLFVWFCLIIQICFQSKLYEFMTSEPRRQSPMNLKDLIQKNYSMFTVQLYDENGKLLKPRNEDRFTEHRIEADKFIKMFLTQAQNTSAKISLIAADIYFEKLKLLAPTDLNWNEIDIKTTKNLVIAFRDNPFYYPMLTKTINQLIDPGIMNKISNNYLQRKRKSKESKLLLKVLSMTDLSFGFHIYVWCCIASLFGYIMEIMHMLYKIAEKMAFPQARPVSNAGTRYCTEEIVEENGQEEIKDSEQLEVKIQENPNESPENLIHDIEYLEVIEEEIETYEQAANETINNNLEVHAEVYKNDEVQESLENFEAKLDMNKCRPATASSENNSKTLVFTKSQEEEQLASDHPHDLQKVISNCMDLELLSVSSMQESLENDCDENDIQLDRNYDILLVYSYFFISESDEIKLVSIEWFGPKMCKPHLKTINIFNKESMKWLSKLKNYEKFLNFHECELTLLVRVSDRNTIKSELGSITSTIFTIASKNYNFTPTFQLGDFDSEHILHESKTDVHLIPVSHTIRAPNVYFEIIDIKRKSSRIRTSNSVMDLQYTVLVPPGELFTPYEKLLLPFDFWTWIFVFITFSITFVSIFCINHLPEKIKDVVYGNKVRTPVWNVVGLIFGIGQTRLPDKSFARFIFILFIWFCLIFQVCFQSKLFEFMTSEPRRPSPVSIRDLIDMNYAIYTFSSETALASGLYHGSKNIVRINPVKFANLFMTQSRNASAKLALVIDEINLQALKQFTKTNPDWKRIENGNKFKSQQVFAFHDYAFHFRMLKKTIDNMIDSGQMENLIKNYYSNSPNNEDSYDDEPRVLAMSDLEFGFYIWIGCCCISILGFVFELFWSFFKNTKTSIPVERPITNLGTRYRSDHEQSDEINIDQTDEVDYGETNKQKMRQDGQDQQHQNMNQNDDNNLEPEGHNVKVLAEVHQSDEMEESILYFEAIIDSNEKRQSESHATDLTEAMSSFEY